VISLLVHILLLKSSTKDLSKKRIHISSTVTTIVATVAYIYTVVGKHAWADLLITNHVMILLGITSMIVAFTLFQGIKDTDISTR